MANTAIFLKLRIAGKENGETVFFKVTVSSHLVDLLEAEVDAINSQDDAVFIAFKMKGLNPFAFEYPQDSEYAGELGVSIGSKLVGIHYMSINGDVIEDEVIEPHQDAVSETSEQPRVSRDSDDRPRQANSKRGQGFNRNNRSGETKRQSGKTRKPARGQRFQQQPAN